MSRFLCIHCHFYQPPRENPWLEDVVLQESAYPYHDWNERITEECYRANGESRILDPDGWVTNMVNNYGKISFNFGPTLLSWMEEKDPKCYERILEGDKLGIDYFGGHGPAIGQAYNHIILPLANRRDKETQIIWGIRDFEKRFQRYPESLWLPETAVDLETLEIMSDHGMKYVILAPRQAKAVRRIDKEEIWHDVSEQRVDPSQAYEIPLPSGRSIAAFFYDGPISQGVAFEGLLHNGERFAKRLLDGFDSSRKRAQLLHIATDGETYGHHHKNGDMALAYALHTVENDPSVQLTNYGQFLALNPPQMQAKIFEDSSWSCVHGVERWRSNCGCNSGMKAGWHQKWRAPLRNTFDEIRDKVNPAYETQMQIFCDHPWAVRTAYIDIITNRSDKNRAQFIKQHCRSQELSLEEEQIFWKILEIQRHLLLMYTSCAWFFDDISGIETVQTIQYAYRAVELAREVLHTDVEQEFLALLAEAPSNHPQLKTGADIFNSYVKPARVDQLMMGAHFAVSSLFEKYSEKNSIYCFDVDLKHYEKIEEGRTTLACGQAKIVSRVTREQAETVFGAIHFGDHNVNASVKRIGGNGVYPELLEDMSNAFKNGDFSAIFRSMEKHLGDSIYSLKDLFKDEQAKVIDEVLQQTLSQVSDSLIQIYDHNYRLTSFLSDLKVPLPGVFRNIADFVQNNGIRQALLVEPGNMDVDVIRRYMNEANRWNIPLDEAGISHAFEEAVEARFDLLHVFNFDRTIVGELAELIEIGKEFPFGVDFGPAQNHYFHLGRGPLQTNLEHSPLDEGEQQQWYSVFERVGKLLQVRG